MGIAFRIRSPSHTYDRYAYVGEGTNNAAELLAAAIALEHAPPQSTITLSSDSQYVIGTLTLGWKRRTNLDLWSRMDAAIQRHTTVTFVKVAGHKGDPDNEAVDRLAHRAARSKTSCREYANAQLPVDLTQVPLEALIAALAAHGFRAERADS